MDEVYALGISSNSLALANFPVLFNYPPGQKRPLPTKMQDSVYGRNCVQAIWRRYAASATSGHTPATSQCFHWDLSLDFSPQESHHVMYYKLFEPVCLQAVMDPHQDSSLISGIFLPNSFFPRPTFLRLGLSSVPKGQLSIVLWLYSPVHLPTQPSVLTQKDKRGIGMKNNAAPYF